MVKIKWKGFYVNFKKLKQNNSIEKTYSNSYVSRSSVICPKFLGFTFNVYTGKSYTEIAVNESMVGHKFGEFTFTRKKFVFKKKQRSFKHGTKSKS